MSPKSLLRHPMAVSSFEEIGPETRFRPLLADPVPQADAVEKVLFCSGKVYYDLVTERQVKKLEDKIAILRVEQICPFPYEMVAREVGKYPNNQRIMWLQEEPKNMGAYYYARDRLAHALGIPVEEVRYGGRPCSASPATGSKVIYQNEYSDMLAKAMDLT